MTIENRDVIRILTIAFALVPILGCTQADDGGYTLEPRSQLKSFPVPSFRPATLGRVIGVDAFPSAGAVAHPDNGYAWFDACDRDIQHANGNVPVACARMGIKPDRVEFGSRSFDGADPKDIYLVRDRQVIGVFDANGLTIFGTVRAQGFEVVP